MSAPHLPPPGGELRRDRPFASRAEVAAIVRAALASPGEARDVVTEDAPPAAAPTTTTTPPVPVSLSPPASPARPRRAHGPRDDERTNPLAQSVDYDDVERDKVAAYEALHAANRRLNNRLQPYFEQRCQSDMLYAFLYAYDACGMDESLRVMVEFVLAQYAQDADAPAPYNTAATAYVRETFTHIVERSRDRTAKLALMLFILAREPRVEARVRAECPAATVRHLDQFMRALRYLARGMLQAKCTRQNIQTLLQTFVVRCGTVYTDELMPAGLDPHTADVTPTYHATAATAPPPTPARTMRNV